MLVRCWWDGKFAQMLWKTIWCLLSKYFHMIQHSLEFMWKNLHSDREIHSSLTKLGNKQQASWRRAEDNSNFQKEEYYLMLKETSREGSGRSSPARARGCSFGHEPLFQCIFVPSAVNPACVYHLIYWGRDKTAWASVPLSSLPCCCS